MKNKPVGYAGPSPRNKLSRLCNLLLGLRGARAEAASPAFDPADITNRLRDLQSPEPSRSLILCTDERTGSHHLAQRLAATGQLGRAYEYFNTPWMKAHYADYPDDVPGQLLWAKRLGTTPNGYFSLKLHPWAMDRVAPHIDLCRDLPAPCFVVLQRRDLLGQALSLHRAQSTQKFTSWSEEQAEPRYDGARIHALLSELALRRERWEIYFARNGIRPLYLDYEGLQSEPEATVARVARHAGLVTMPVMSGTDWYRFERQSDHINDAWRERFLADYADTSSLDTLPG